MGAPAHRDPLQLSDYIQRLRAKARRAGIEISYEVDFEELRTVSAGLDDRPQVYPVFDPSRSETSRRNAFWIRGTDRAGGIAHFQALRRFNMGETSLADHLIDFKRLYTHPDANLSVDETDTFGPWFSKSLTGVGVYHGEVWVRKDLRGKELGYVLPRIGIAIAQLTWRPDFLFSIASPEVAYKGLLERYGYTHVLPKAFVFRNDAGAIVRKAWLAVLISREFADVIWDEGIQPRARRIAQAV